jgi:hypothetical protein
MNILSRTISNLGNLVKGNISGILATEKQYVQQLKTTPVKTLGTDFLIQQAGQGLGAGLILGAPVVAANPQSTIAVVKALPAIAAGGFVGSVVLRSEKLTAAAVKTPGAVNQFSADISTAIDNPSVNNIINIGKNNPLLTSLAIAAGTLVVSKAASTAATIANTNAVNASNDLAKDTKDKVVELAGGNAGAGTTIINNYIQPPPAGLISQGSPSPSQPPAAAVVKKTATKKKAKPKKKAAKKKAKPKKKSKKYIKKKKKSKK